MFMIMLLTGVTARRFPSMLDIVELGSWVAMCTLTVGWTWRWLRSRGLEGPVSGLVAAFVFAGTTWFMAVAMFLCSTDRGAPYGLTASVGWASGATAGILCPALPYCMVAGEVLASMERRAATRALAAGSAPIPHAMSITQWSAAMAIFGGAGAAAGGVAALAAAAVSVLAGGDEGEPITVDRLALAVAGLAFAAGAAGAFVSTPLWLACRRSGWRRALSSAVVGMAQAPAAWTLLHTIGPVWNGDYGWWTSHKWYPPDDVIVGMVTVFGVGLWPVAAASGAAVEWLERRRRPSQLGP
jgi:hypothetical protein